MKIEDARSILMNNLVLEVSTPDADKDYTDALNEGIKALDKQIKDELVEVVRCKDCQKRNTALCPYKYAEIATTDILTDDNDFCSYGKRLK